MGKISAKAMALFICLLSGCTMPQGGEEKTQKPASLELEKMSFAEMPGWSTDLQDAALLPLSRSCGKIGNLPPEKNFGTLPEMGTVGDWQKICQAMPNWELASPEEARAFFETNFVPYRLSADGNPEGLFTGYYEASLHGSPVRTAKYNVPLRARPEDLVMVNLGEFRDELKGQRIAGRVKDGQLKPYEDRAAIENGKLPAAMDKPLLWVDSAVDAFFLQIQGSGVVQMEDGSSVRVGYDGQNGHIYTAIGKELIQRGALTKENVSMQTIRAWLGDNPAEAAALMQKNRSYVFFRKLDTDGPVGAQGVVLAPERSLAVDPVYIPYGAPIFVDADAPRAGENKINQLLIAQDTGGAIRGPVRGDFFWGYGDRAADLSGVMKSKGRGWILLPR